MIPLTSAGDSLGEPGRQGGGFFRQFRPIDRRILLVHAADIAFQLSNSTTGYGDAETSPSWVSFR